MSTLIVAFMPIIVFFLCAVFLLIVAKKRGRRGYRPPARPGEHKRDTPWHNKPEKRKNSAPSQPEEACQFSLHDDCAGEKDLADDPFAVDMDQFSNRDEFRK